MLAEVTREPDQLSAQIERQPQPPILRIEVEIGHALLRHALHRPTPNLAGQHGGDVFGKPERLADIAHGAARAIARHGGGERRAVAAIGVIDPLDHLRALIVLEVDVDVGRLAALLADEALEQQVRRLRIDGGDAEHVAHGGIGGRSPALAQDVPRSGEADDGVDGEEVGRVAERLDQAELVPQQPRRLRRHAAGKAHGGALPGQPFEVLLRGDAGLGDLVRILVAQFIEREAAAPHDLRRRCDRSRMAGEEPCHLLGRLEMTVGEAVLAEAGIIDRAPFPDAGEHVLQDAPLGRMEQHVVGGDAPHPGRGREIGEALQPCRIAGPAAERQRQIGAVAEVALEAGDAVRELGIDRVGHQAGDQALAMGDQVAPAEAAGPFPGAALAEGQQPAEPRIGCLVGRIDEDRDAIVEVEPAADDETHAGRLGSLVSAHHAGEGVAVDDAQGRNAEQARRREQLLGMRGAAQKGEVRGDLELRVIHHAKSPCRNQRCEPVAGSTPSPAR